MDFETKDSGERVEYESGMRRDVNTGKARFDLLWAKDVPYGEQFLTRVALLLARGAAKYGDRNWEKARSPEELERFLESGLRHHAQYAAGETDEDHAAAVVFNIYARETVRYLIEQDKDASVEMLKTAIRMCQVDETVTIEREGLSVGDTVKPSSSLLSRDSEYRSDMRGVVDEVQIAYDDVREYLIAWSHHGTKMWYSADELTEVDNEG